MRAIVIGSGIGGLTAALTLRRAGIDVAIFEQASELREIGAGITMTPNASRILHRLGLEDAMRTFGVQLESIVCRRYDDGRVLARYTLGDEVRRVHGAPSYYFYRPELLDLLAAPIPKEIIHLDHKLAGLTEHHDLVEARFADGSTAEADVLIGADGIHSAVREELFGPESPRFSGMVAYRGLVSPQHLGGRPELQFSSWWGPIRHMIYYPVGRDARFLNVVAGAPAKDWQVESWSSTGDVNDLIAEYADWNVEVRDLIAKLDPLYKLALYDRNPLPRWSKGRVTLLGDAAHAMLPSMGQGAAQAIEDAAVLAKCLEGISPAEIPLALERYENFRRPRTNRCQQGSRSVNSYYRMADGEEQRKRDANFEATLARLYPGPQNSWLWGYDAEAEFDRA